VHEPYQINVNRITDDEGTAASMPASDSGLIQGERAIVLARPNQSDLGRYRPRSHAVVASGSASGQRRVSNGYNLSAHASAVLALRVQAFAWSSVPRMTRDRPELRASLDNLYESFDHPEAALDPIQIVRRYPRIADREVVGFVAAGLAFGRVASVMASVEAVCDVLGDAPGVFVRQFEPARDGARLRHLVHRWTRGDDIVSLIWILRHLIDRYGSLETAFAAGLPSGAVHVGEGLEQWSSAARAVDLQPVYGARVPDRPGAHYFFSRPSTGGACKRLNLFLRWMVRQDGVDPGGWRSVRPSQLIVPLDTHTIRVGRCLRLTRRASPGWKMAMDITDALRAIDADDPVRYDFALCHLSMMGSCGWHTTRGNSECPLRGVCRPVRG